MIWFKSNNRCVIGALTIYALTVLGGCGGGSGGDAATNANASAAASVTAATGESTAATVATDGAASATASAAASDATDTLHADAVQSQTQQTIEAAKATEQVATDQVATVSPTVTSAAVSGTVSSTPSLTGRSEAEATTGEVAAAPATSAAPEVSAQVQSVTTAVVDAGTTATWVKLASENALFRVNGTKTVRFGRGSSWITKASSTGGRCNTAYFGGDPAPGWLKECDGPPPIPTPALRAAPQAKAPSVAFTTSVGWGRAAVERGTFTVGPSSLVRYGMDSRWITKTVSGQVQCTNAFFGSDPAHGTVKECDVPSIAQPTVTLKTLATDANAVLQYVGATQGCKVGFTPGAALRHAAPAPLPSSGGAFYTAADLTRWRARALDGPFVSQADYKTGTPGDWVRILANANQFALSGDIIFSAASLPTEGLLARDSAFAGLVVDRADLKTAAVQHLLSFANNKVTDFTGYCYRSTDGTSPGADAWRDQALWINRYAFIYDMLRTGMSDAERLQVENWLRAQAYFFAGQLDYDLGLLFPKRLDGDYSVKSRDADPASKTPYLAHRFDTNGDCAVNAYDDSRTLPSYAYVDATGKFGPSISLLSQWYNNRRANLAVSIGSIGILLGDANLIGRAKRYQMEWLTWAVYADGSEGEYSRSGDYCIPDQGLIYAQSNVQSAVQLAVWLQRSGDSSLIDFYTADGEWGTQASPGMFPKSIEHVIATQLGLWTGSLKWFQAEPWLPIQLPRTATRMGNLQSRFMNGGMTDDFQELGLLLGEYIFPNQPIRNVLLREGSASSLSFPGVTGNQVITGKGSWSDMFGMLPSMYFWEL